VAAAHPRTRDPLFRGHQVDGVPPELVRRGVFLLFGGRSASMKMQESAEKRACLLSRISALADEEALGLHVCVWRGRSVVRLRVCRCFD